MTSTSYTTTSTSTSTNTLNYSNMSGGGLGNTYALHLLINYALEKHKISERFRHFLTGINKGVDIGWAYTIRIHNFTEKQLYSKCRTSEDRKLVLELKKAAAREVKSMEDFRNVWKAMYPNFNMTTCNTTNTTF